MTHTHDDDRYVKPEDVEVEKYGYFIGYGKEIDLGAGFDYRYVAYSGPEAVKEMYPGFVSAVAPLVDLFSPDFYAEMMEAVDKFEWKMDEPHLYTAEIGMTPIFVSNHIPKNLEEGHPTKFTMLADHSQCTKDHCVNEKPETEESGEVETAD